MSTRNEMRAAERALQDKYKIYLDYFCTLFHNSVKFDNLPADVPKRYVLSTLLRTGYIINYGDLYLKGYGTGVDIYGYPTHYTLVSANGEVLITRPLSDIAVLRVNDLSKPLYPYLKMQAMKLANIDNSIDQNLDSVKTMSVFEVANESYLLTLTNADKARRVGAMVGYVNKDMLETNRLNVLSTGATYLCDKLIELKKEIMNETLTRLGVMTANVDKRERVQEAEVNATVGETVDNIHIMVDTFNYDAEIAGCPLRMNINTTVERYYALDGKDNSKGGEDGDRSN